MCVSYSNHDMSNFQMNQNKKIGCEIQIIADTQ